MKKTAIVVLAVMLLLAQFVFANGAQEGAAAPAAQSGPVHIEMWYNATQTEVGPLPNDWVGYKILKDKFNIDLEASSLPSAYGDQDMKIQAAAAADQLPDFFCASREVWLRLAQNGMLADVTDLYAKMPNRTRIMFDEGAIAYTTLDDGRSYGFATPSAISKNEGLLIREDWLNKLGLKVPTTLDELYDVLYAFRNNDPDGNGKKDTYGYGAFVETNTYEAYPGRRFEPLMGAFGVEGTWDMHKASAGLQIHKPEFYDFLVFLKKVIDNDLIDPNWMAYKKDDFRAAWKQGKFGVFREQNSAYASQNNFTPFDTNFPDGGFVIVEPPVGPTGKKSIGPSVRGLRIWCISQKAFEEGKADKICEMFEWMADGEGYELCGWGIKGEQWEIGPNGVPVSINGEKGFDGPIGQTYIQLRSMAFNYGSDYELVSRYPVWTRKNGKQQSALWALREMQEKTWTNAAGSEALPVPSTDLKTFYEQGIAEFLTGKKELTEANWKAFVEQFDKLGGKAWEEEGVAKAKANGFLY